MIGDMLIVNSLFAAADACKPSTFLGLVPWYQYLDYGKLEGIDGDYCGVNNFQLLGNGSDLPLILLAVVDDLLRIVGLISVVFIIYGGIMYVTSQGSPDQASKAQSTIINALIGLAIAIIAVAIVSFVGKSLGPT